MKTSSLLRISSAALALFSLAGLAWADEISDAYDALKKAQESKNVPDVKKWAVETSKLARAESAKPQPADASQVDYWKQRVEYSKSTDTFTEYALGVTAILPNLPPAQIVDLVDTLLDLNPKSIYLAMTLPTYIAALPKAGGVDKQIAGATKVLAAVPDSEDALYALAEGNMTKNRPDQAGTYAARLVSTLISKAKPVGVSDADWNTKKTGLSGRGNYIAGVSACLRELWPECDKFLRAAVTQVNQPALTGPAYFYLGLANYRIGMLTNNRPKIQEGIKFSNQSAAIAGPMQQQARQNAFGMEKDLATRK